jgi:phage major head subunit gpT-like protein
MMNKDYNYRSLDISGRFASLDTETRSVEVTAATENPVQIFDWEHGLVDEVLLMNGAKVPFTRQVPLLDSHNRHDTSTVIGSFQRMDIDGSELVGRAFFSERAEDQWGLVRDKHLTDFSIGYRVDPKESVWVPDGEVYSHNGREYEGPVLIRKKWYPKELSLVPIGADEMAKARSEYQYKKEQKTMENKNEKKEPMAEAKNTAPAVDLEAVRAEAAALERQRITEIDAICKRAKLEEKADGWKASNHTIDDVKRLVSEELIKRYEERDQPGFGASIEKDEVEKFRAAAVNYIMPFTGVKMERKNDGLSEMRGFRISDIVKRSLELAGQSTRGTREELFQRATLTSDLPYILANVLNKAVTDGWETENETWRQWCQTGSASDFKSNTIVRPGHVDTLEETPDGTPVRFGSMTDGGETVALKTYAKRWAIGRQAIINDDMNVFADLNMAYGASASRTVGDVAYAVLTANSAMGDGLALFVAGHGNLAAGGNVGLPGFATWGEADRAMGVQTDDSGKQRLNIMPAFIIAPRAQKSAVMQFFGSEKFSDPDTIATDSSLASSRYNPYYQAVEQVFDARLDAVSTTAWYAAAANNTVRVLFLNGEQQPTIMRTEGTAVLGMEFTVYLDLAAKAVDWRGLYKNPGA